MFPVAVVVGFVGNQLGVFIIPKNGIKNIRSGDPSFRQNAWVQAPEYPDVTYQTGVVSRATLILG
jgi:hypothetical protein